MRSATVSGDSTVVSDRSRQPTMICLPASFVRIEQSSFDCAVSIEIWRQAAPASSGRNEYPDGRWWMIAA